MSGPDAGGRLKMTVHSDNGFFVRWCEYYLLQYKLSSQQPGLTTEVVTHQPGIYTTTGNGDVSTGGVLMTSLLVA